MSTDIDQILEPQRRRLDGWKEIASHLGKGLSVRTAQRWEEDGLPVGRENGKVFAYTDELDRWILGRIVTPSGEAVCGPPANDNKAPLRVRERRLTRVAAGVLVVAGMVTAVVWAIRRPTDMPLPPATQWGRLLVKATSEDGALRRLQLNQQPSYTAVSPDGRKVYAAAELSRSLSIFHMSDGRVATVPLTRDAGRFVMSRDGEKLYILSPSGGIVVIDTRREEVAPRVISTPGPVYEGALTPDGKKLFVTMNRLGVWRMLTVSGQLKQVTNQICPVYLALDTLGQNLVVSYQCGGPKGRNGHDSMEVFNAETEESLGIANGPPLVGGPLSVSPDGRQVVVDGLDVCTNPDYDHEGCPSVPSLVFHFLRLADRQFVKTIGLPNATVGGPRFIDHAHVLFVGSSLTVMDTSQYVVTERWEDKSEVFNDGPVVLAALRKVFIPVYKRKEILILEAESPECSAPSEGLALFYPGDGTVDDVMGGAHLTAVDGVRFGPGRVGQSFVLDGKSGYLVAPWTPFYNFGLRDSSVAMYVKFATTDGEMLLFEHPYSQAATFARLTKSRDHRFHFELVTGPGTTAIHLFSSTHAISDRWYQVCITKNNKEVVLYVNGTAEDHKNFRPEEYNLGGPRAPFYLGGSQDHQRFLHGKLDEILFYSRDLSSAEVRSLYRMREFGACKL